MIGRKGGNHLGVAGVLGRTRRVFRTRGIFFSANDNVCFFLVFLGKCEKILLKMISEENIEKYFEHAYFCLLAAIL